MGKACGRRRLSQVITMRRVTIMAVNMDVAMPIDNVTAKPRTGPEPKR